MLHKYLTENTPVSRAEAPFLLTTYPCTTIVTLGSHSAGRVPRPPRFNDRDTHPSGGAALGEEYGGIAATIFELPQAELLRS